MSDTAEIEPVRRIFGLESEYGTAGYGLPTLNRTIRLDGHFNDIGQIGGFVSNGARVYLDVGGHLEYATPECQSIRELVASDIAGQELLKNFVEITTEGKTTLNTRVVDDNGHSWGSHENYQTTREVDPNDEETAMVLASHLVTRSILTGAGMLVHHGNGSFNFRVVQKLRSMKELHGEHTTRDKPIVNTRDEPHANRNEFRRLHIISGDATMSPWATAIRFGSTSLVIRMLEHEDLIDVSDCILEDPVLAAKVFVKNRNVIVPLLSGEKVTFADIQKRFIAKARRLQSLVKLPDEEQILLDEWERGVDDFVQDNTALVSRADWATKWKIIENQKDRDDKGKRADKIHDTDILWGELSKDGIARLIREKGRFRDPLGSLELVDELMFEPPHGRAKLRGGAILSLTRANNNKPSISAFTADWSSVGREQDRAYLSDPFGENEDEIRRMKQYIEARR